MIGALVFGALVLAAVLIIPAALDLLGHDHD